jgi:mono/diheme cytochrome c family protein
MKKTTLICLAIVVMYSCAKKMTPAASAPSTDKASATVTAATTPVSESKPTAMKTETLVAPVTSEAAIVTEVTATDAISTKKETKQVVAGKEVFKAKCGRCHELKAPENYTTAKWIKIVDWMAPKAKLDASEKENVLAYGSFYAKSGS